MLLVSRPRGGRPAALDIFVTSGLQPGLLGVSAVDGGAAIVGRWNGTSVSGVPKFANCKGASNEDVTFEFLRRKL